MKHSVRTQRKFAITKPNALIGSQIATSCILWKRKRRIIINGKQTDIRKFVYEYWKQRILSKNTTTTKDGATEHDHLNERQLPSSSSNVTADGTRQHQQKNSAKQKDMCVHRQPMISMQSETIEYMRQLCPSDEICLEPTHIFPRAVEKSLDEIISKQNDREKERRDCLFVKQH